MSQYFLPLVFVGLIGCFMLACQLLAKSDSK